MILPPCYSKMADGGAEVDPNHPKAKGIQAIDKASVHRICSGQVVLTLATAVKELVENSVDAGATIVEVKLKDYGSECIEVSDNGCGVEEANFEGLTLKHHTSKLSDFSDLINVETFGFRGEALSSLCALGDMSIITRHQSVAVGTKLTYDHHGRIGQKLPQARQVGTTVTLQNLFYTLPVRHKEFQRNLKKEFAKMVQVLNSYCIISTGVRISCTNQTGKGNKSIVVSTKGNDNIRDNIANIFGPKQVQSLLEFKAKNPNEDVCTEFGVKSVEDGFSMFRFEGYVSKCEHGQGRSSTDRQFYFINKRPCDSAKLSKVVNEVYHQYNRHQYPFVLLKIDMEKDAVDVNVTPDKRQIFLQGEKLLMAIIKSSLVSMFEPTTSVYRVNQLTTFSRQTVLPHSESESKSPKTNGIDHHEDPNKQSVKESIVNTLSKLKRSFSSAFSKESDTDKSSSRKEEKQDAKQRRLDGFVCRMSSPYSSPIKDGYVCRSSPYSSPNKSQSAPGKLLQHSSDTVLTVIPHTPASTDCSVLPTNSAVQSNTDSESDTKFSEYLEIVKIEESNVRTRSETENECTTENIECHLKSDCDTTRTSVTCNENINQKYVTALSSGTNGGSSDDLTSSHVVSGGSLCGSIDTSKENMGSVEEMTLDRSSHSEEKDLIHKEAGMTFTELDKQEQVQRKEKSIQFSLQTMRQKFLQKKEKGDGNRDLCRKFRAQINPTDNTAAEEELQKEIKKENFAEMEILGQFNLGFIIVKLGEDLFIVDQHATDEKYNFEMLQRHTVIQSQKLIQPLTLELTASNETILIDNLDIFKKNGFDFKIDEEADPTQRVKLLSTPVSKNWNFGKDDIEEMIFMLTDSSGVMCRPSRVRQMFASRACRKAIMIGTALNRSEMKKLVSHMGEIEQPWNCPHGRPTMRHLISLNMVPR